MPAPETRSSVAVIVLNWNGTADTLECLASLSRMTYPRFELIVVDNGSRPSPRQQILAAFPTITFLETDENLGYAGGNNVGIRAALAAGHDFVFVLNNDTIVEPDVLDRAIAVASCDASIGVLGVKIIAWDDPGRVWVAYGEVTYRQGLVRLIGYYGLDDGRFDQQRDVEWVPGTAMLMSRRALEQVGLFDEEFFAYHEDVDWCTLARTKGFRVVYSPEPRIYHKGHRSSGGKGYVTPRQYLAGRNMVLYVRKHATPLQMMKFLAFQLATVPLQYVRRWLSGEQAGVRSKVRGMLDAVRGRPLPLVELGLRQENV
ncbi:MAG TPA: glycosyltransferase family 2 protein [Candidatus Acidoferrales bacterium]|nr:glycosyltransferase family 2 protein [Candidatus Acidoferrales bacterium]